MTGRNVVCVNGDFLPAARATIPALDSGFSYGDGVFETFLVVDGRAPFLDAHVERFGGAADALGLALPDAVAGVAALASLVERLASENGFLSAPAGCRVSVSRGTRPPGPLAAPDGPPTFVASIFPVPPPGADSTPAPVRAGVSADVVFSPAPWTRFKTLSSLFRVLGRAEAARRGLDDVIFADASGRIAEATSRNVFVLLEDGVWATPPLSLGVLPGITRAILLRALGAGGVERELRGSDLASARGACLTGSLRGVEPLASVDRARFDPEAAALPRRLVAAAIRDALTASRP